MAKWIVLLLLVAVIGIQFIPVDRGNPAAGAALQTPPEVSAILERACYDCHSNNTVWPWYSTIAPASFFVARHVKEGRHELNFSEWDAYSAPRKQKKAEELLEQIGEGKMPLKSYLWMHKNARLAQADKDILKSWTPSLLEPDLESDEQFPAESVEQ